MVGVTGIIRALRVRFLSIVVPLALAAFCGSSATSGEEKKDAPRPTAITRRDPDALVELPSCLDVSHFANVVAPGATSTAILYLVKAVVRDDGGKGDREPADIDLVVLGGERYDVLLNRVRLYGPIDGGTDRDGSPKRGWNDDSFLRYNGFGIAALDGGRKLRLIAVPADHAPTTPAWIRKVSSRGAVFDGVLDLEALPWGDVVRVDGTCDHAGRCVTLWLARENEATGGTGRYWKCP